MNKFVVNATNSNLHYSYFIPIISLMWKTIGYTPITLLFGSDWTGNPKTNYVLDNIKKHSAVWPLPYTPGFKESTCVQISRIFAAAAPEYKPDDYILTSDADMIPLSKTWFHQQDFNKKFHIFGADAYGRARFPICYLGATVTTWKEVMDIHTIGIGNTMQTNMNHNRDNWDYDELLFTEKIHHSPIYPNQCHLINRGWPDGIAAGRLDRVAWNWQNQTDLIDSHSPRPGYLNWTSLSCLFRLYCSEVDFKYIQEYTETLNKL